MYFSIGAYDRQDSRRDSYPWSHVRMHFVQLDSSYTMETVHSSSSIFSFNYNSAFDYKKLLLHHVVHFICMHQTTLLVTCKTINLKCALWKEDFAQTKYSMRIIKVCACSCPDGNYTYFSCIEALSKNFFILSWHFFMTPTSYGIEMNKMRVNEILRQRER